MSGYQGGIFLFTAHLIRARWTQYLLATTLTLLVAARSDAALTFDVDYSPAVGSSPAIAGIFAGVTAATSTWSSTFSDDITVSVLVQFDAETTDVDFPSPGTFGAALNKFEEYSYVSVKSAMALDAESPGDFAAMGTLQPGPVLEALTHDTSFTPPSGSSSPEIRIGALSPAKWNSILRLTRANGTALGLPVPVDGAHDIRLQAQDFSGERLAKPAPR